MRWEQLKLILFSKPYNTYRFDNSRNITIRSIANDLKHKRNIRLSEFRAPTNLNVNINGFEFNTKRLFDEKGMVFRYEQEIFEQENPDRTIAKAISTHYGDEQTIDIQYVNGELFRGEDLVKSGKTYSLAEIYVELLDYNDQMVSLFNTLKKVLDQYVEINPQYQNIKYNSTSYNMDTFFKATKSEPLSIMENSIPRKYINYGKHKVFKLSPYNCVK